MERITVLLTVMCALRAECAVTSVSESEKQLIVDLHNQVRSEADPKPAYMMKLYWHENLQRSAEKYIAECLDRHNDNDVRAADSYLNMTVGQNLAGQSAPKNWTWPIEAWHNEFRDGKFHYGGQDNSGGHYVQMMLGRTTHVGCAVNDCPQSKWTTHYACHYANQYLDSDIPKPWRGGSGCDDCGGTCTDNLCDCGGLLCENGGLLNITTCACECVRPFVGEACHEKDCTDVEDWYVCGPDPPEGWGGPSLCGPSYMTNACPHMCGFC